MVLWSTVLVETRTRVARAAEGISILDDDAEVKKVNLAISDENTASEEFISRCLSQFSSWVQLNKFVAWVLILKKCLQNWLRQRQKLISKEEHQYDPSLVDVKMRSLKLLAMTGAFERVKHTTLTLSQLDEAEHALFVLEQRRHFQEELKKLESDQEISTKSKICKLDPIMHDGLLRVGGRLGNASIPYESKHQIILPAESIISRLLIESTHQRLGHLGRNSIVAEVRQRFWIVGGNALIKKIMSQYVVCQKYRAKSMQQKMADLPMDRTVSGEASFTRVGVDYFGPFKVKRGRATVKSYGVVFSCLVTRAIHLEVASSLDTDACINAMRRSSADEVRSML